MHQHGNDGPRGHRIPPCIGARRGKTRRLLYEAYVVVGEHFLCVEAGPVRAGGAQGRENVGTSNHKARENRAPRKSKVSSATNIDGG